MNNNLYNYQFKNYDDLSYSELNDEIKKLKENYDEMNIERINIIAPVFNIAKTYPNLIPKQILSGNSNDMTIQLNDVSLLARITIAISNIEHSDLLENEKESAINILKEVSEKIENNFNYQAEYWVEIQKSEVIKNEKLAKLQEKYDKLKEIEKEIIEIDIEIYGTKDEKLNKFLEEYKKEMKQRGADIKFLDEITEGKIGLEEYKKEMQQREVNPLAVSGIDEDIRNLKERRKKLEKEIELITSGYENDLDAFVEEKKIEVTKIEEAKAKAEKEAKEKEEKEARAKAERELEKEQEEKKEPVPEENKDTESTPEENKEEPTKKDPLDPVKPEKPKKPRSKHKASPELKNKIKKVGKAALGITLIGLAAAAVIANPLLVAKVFGAALGGGLVIDELKNGKSK